MNYFNILQNKGFVAVFQLLIPLMSSSIQTNSLNFENLIKCTQDLASELDFINNGLKNSKQRDIFSFKLDQDFIKLLFEKIFRKIFLEENPYTV